MKNDNAEPSIPKEVITYVAAHCEAKISEAARNTNQPEQELREWVAIFLFSSWTGLSNYMPSLRRKATKVYSTARKMAMVNNSHLKSPQSASHKQNSVTSNKKGFSYKGKHWTQQPKNRARLREQVRKMHLAKGHKIAA